MFLAPLVMSVTMPVIVMFRKERLFLCMMLEVFSIIVVNVIIFVIITNLKFNLVLIFTWSCSHQTTIIIDQHNIVIQSRASQNFGEGLTNSVFLLERAKVFNVWQIKKLATHEDSISIYVGTYNNLLCLNSHGLEHTTIWVLCFNFIC